jgi:hypothetical protein
MEAKGGIDRVGGRHKGLANDLAGSSGQTRHGAVLGRPTLQRHLGRGLVTRGI